ncbi:MAG: hypothetical protein A2014_12845 [Spirochaetes bacterium GWF1_49_6]|nr:MAG: hypothetical protein A2014_12845 [Spirochaetes bacterium GWF1_49_6]
MTVIISNSNPLVKLLRRLFPISVKCMGFYASPDGTKRIAVIVRTAQTFPDIRDVFRIKREPERGEKGITIFQPFYEPFAIG